MTVAERKLEEDEAKIDNILHKVIRSAEKVQDLNKQIDPSSTPTSIQARKDRIGILIETIIHLATLADEIDINDEKLTEEVEVKIKDELNTAVKKITEAEELLDKEI